MSIEQQIEALTSAILGLTAAITNNPACGSHSAPTEVVAAKKPTPPKTEKPASTEPAASPATASPQAADAAVTKASPSDEQQESPDVAKQIQDRVLALVGAGKRDAVVGVFAKFGVTKASALKLNQLDNALQALLAIE